MQRRRDGKTKGGKARTLNSVNKQISAICSTQFVGKILKTEVKQVPKGLDLTFRTNQSTLDALSLKKAVELQLEGLSHTLERC